MPAPRNVRRSYTRVLSAITLALGVAIVVSTLARGGGPAAVGILLGVLFIALGGARLYLATRD